MVLTNAHLEIDGEDYSGRTTTVALNLSTEAVDNTPMGSKARIQHGGIEDWTFSAEFTVGESLFHLKGAVVPIVIRGDADGDASPSNPEYTGNALITEYVPLDGSVGDAWRIRIAGVSSGELTESVGE